MQPYQASQIFMAIGMLASAGVISIYALIQTGKLDADERQLARPLFLTAAGLGLLGVSSGSSFTYIMMIELFNMTVTRSLVVAYVAIVLGAGTLSVAALLILGRKYLLIIPAALMVLGLFLSITGVQLGLSSAFVDSMVTLFTIILLLLPGFLFGYLTYRTKTAKSFALAVAMLAYLISYASQQVSLEGNVFLILLRLAGPGMVVSAFSAEGLDISGELVGYGSAFGVAGVWFSFVMTEIFGGTHVSVDLTMEEIWNIASLSELSIVGVLGLATVAYTYGRWRKRPNPATIYLGAFFLLASLSILIFSMQEMDLFVSMNITYVTWIMFIGAVMLMNIGAIVVLDWKRAILLPVIIALPVAAYLIMGYPANPITTPWFSILLILSTALQLIIPMGMYIYLWHQMRLGSVKNRSRPLFLGIGIAIALAGLANSWPIGNFVNPVVASLFLVAFIIWLLGITGRADQLLDTD
ncbi:MAG: hypothetical protein KGY80_11870 [Candidatus Thorarchaeota archaeon]|nr:hypothetical protein [Candidatus Thorarchaeota archaeon]